MAPQHTARPEKKTWIATNAPVAIVRCDDYDRSTVLSAVRKACDAASIPSVDGLTVLVKPNVLSDAKVELNITTNPEIVRALIRILRERGAKTVLVGDSPGIQGPSFVPRNCGLQEVCEEERAEWCDFTKEPDVRTVPGSFGKRLPFAHALQEADMVFSVAKFKTHQLMYATGTVKNLFGLVPGLHKSPCHLAYPSRESFARLVAGIYSIAKPSFNILDGVIAMEGAGPANGTPRHLGLILAGCDGTAVDAAQSTIMGYDPLTIPLTQALLDRKLTGWRTPQEISYPMLDANDLVVEDYKRIEQQPSSHLFTSLVLPLFTRVLKLRHQKKQPEPLFDMSRCIRCGRCVRICPGKALSLVGDGNDRRISIDYGRCIRCYCCHEVCPADAIRINSTERTEA